MKLTRIAFALPLLLLLTASIPFPLIGYKYSTSIHFNITGKKNTSNKLSAENYDVWKLESTGLSKEAFIQAVKGFNFFTDQYQLTNMNILTIVDFSKSSAEKRLYVLDMKEGKILFNTLVAHGRNSGSNYASDFSNEEESHKSSLGFYITMGTYNGSNGYSLKLKGCEEGINDKALNREIVMHGADYVSDSFVKQHGYLGRSYGCPAVPMAIHKKIIDNIKNGSCLFIYYPAKNYSTQSKILNS